MATPNAPKFHTMEEMRDCPRSYLSSGYTEMDELAAKAVRALYGERDDADIRALPYGTFGRTGITSVIRLVGAGRHIVAANNIFPGTWAYLTQMAPVYGWEVSFIDNINDTNQLNDAVRPGTALFICEVTSNPMLVVTHLDPVIRFVRAINPSCVIMVDDTVNAGARHDIVGQRFSPLRFGADIAAYSLSKHVAADGLERGGVLIGQSKLMDALQQLQGLEGALLHPEATRSLMRRLDPDELLRRQYIASRNALILAEALGHTAEKVYYPGLLDHPTYTNTQGNKMKSYGGLVTLDLGDMKTAARVGNALAKAGIATISNSFGEENTLAEAMVFCMPQHAQLFADMGIPPGVLRISCGWGIDTNTMAQQAIQAADIVARHV